MGPTSSLGYVLGPAGGWIDLGYSKAMIGLLSTGFEVREAWVDLCCVMLNKAATSLSTSIVCTVEVSSPTGSITVDIR